jgi:hypothetical protein
MAQHGTLATAENRRHPPTEFGQFGPPNRVDAGHDRMKPPRPQSVLDRAPGQAEIHELRAGDDTVLGRRQVPGLPRWAICTRHGMYKSSIAVVCPPWRC